MHKYLDAFLRNIVRPLLAVLVALVIGALVILLSHQNPWEAYNKMLFGAFGNFNRIAETLERSIPVILAALGTAVAFTSGVFNAGVEGSLYLGAFASFLVGYELTLPAIIHIPLALLGAMLVGAAWAFIPGWAKAYYKADETVTTILLNYVAVLITSYLVAIPFKDLTAGTQQTPAIHPSAYLPRFLPPSRVHIGLFIAIGVAIFLYWLLRRTTLGYNIRIVGMNGSFAEYVGVDVPRTMIKAMLMSGAIGGLAGACQVMGILRRFVDGFSPGYGFEGIMVALLARNHPLGIILAGLFYGALQTGAAYMDRTTAVPKELLNSMVAVIIFFVTAEGLFAFLESSEALREKLRRWHILKGHGGKGGLNNGFPG
ncbi:ABC transporter permease [Moorella sp. Hama-1]|uniref:ABC transporter permease n=1 Tax=Moorella sp. Hama-1 TaxID=2138101 RepID=UPI000D652F8B|nr:ABC transporter permease [Moorella sp. Hama-1]BCV20298.1 ABC transporter permease [Moorella sp. Hama-1]